LPDTEFEDPVTGRFQEVLRSVLPGQGISLSGCCKGSGYCRREGKSFADQPGSAHTSLRQRAV